MKARIQAEARRADGASRERRIATCLPLPLDVRKPLGGGLRGAVARWRPRAVKRTSTRRRSAPVRRSASPSASS